MITQIIINKYKDKDIHIYDNYGDVEPFKSALKMQFVDDVSLIEYLYFFTGYSKRITFTIHHQKHWDNILRKKFIIPRTVSEYLFSIFNKPKNIF